MQFSQLTEQVKKFERHLKNKDRAYIINNMGGFRHLEEYLQRQMDRLEDIPRTATKVERTNAKTNRVVITGLHISIKETLDQIENVELLDSEFPQQAQLVADAFKALQQFEDSREKPETSTSLVDAPYETLDVVFTKSTDQARIDAERLKPLIRKGKKLSKPAIIKATRTVVIQTEPSIRESDVIQADISFMRVSEGYIIIPDQKVMIIKDPNNAYEAIVKEHIDKSKYIALDEYFYAEGICYVWVMEPSQYGALLENREVNAWVCY